MTLKQAADVVRRFNDHQWAYEIADDGTIVVGGNDHQEAIHRARQFGYKGRIVHLYEVTE